MSRLQRTGRTIAFYGHRAALGEAVNRSERSGNSKTAVDEARSQVVILDPIRIFVPAIGRTYTILGLLPEASGELWYRIKVAMEPRDRNVRESDIERWPENCRLIVLEKVDAALSLVTSDSSEVAAQTTAPAIHDIAEDDIHVEQDLDKGWSVLQGGGQPALVSYPVKGHALAYAHAVAFSRRVEMVLHDANGQTVRQQRSSLTYPTLLD